MEAIAFAPSAHGETATCPGAITATMSGAYHQRSGMSQHSRATVDLDAAASDKKHVCDNYFTAETDALSKEWHGKVWLNPPFGHGVEQWFEKVVNEVHTNADSVHVLIPARTDTRWFHEWVMPFATEIYFFKGRLYYVNEKGENKNPAAFPSMLCVFRKKTGSCGDVPTIKASSRDGSAFREAVEWL